MSSMIKCSCGERHGCKGQSKVKAKVARHQEKQRVEERQKARNLAARSVVQGVKGKSEQLQAIAKEQHDTRAKEEHKDQAASDFNAKAATKHKYNGPRTTITHPASGTMVLRMMESHASAGLQTFSPLLLGF
jgi:hypothetical protein